MSFEQDVLDILEGAFGAAGGTPLDVNIVGASVVQVDLATVDVEALVNGIAGAAGVTATQYDLDQLLDRIADAQDYVVSAAYTATLGADALITTAFTTGALPANLVRIVLIPQGDIYWKINGVASAATHKIPANTVWNMPFTDDVAATIHVFAASVVCDLLVCTPRS